MKLGIDLGTSKITAAIERKGVILSEPAVIAVHKKTHKIMYIGEKAREMLGKTNPDIVPVHPMKDGVVADYEATEILLNHFLKKICGKIRIFKPDVVLSVPAKITSIEERAIREVALSAGAKDVYLIPSPLAAAIGEGLSISEPAGNMVVDIGAGTTDIGIISLNTIVMGDSLRIGGNKMDDSIVRYVRRVYNLVIGEQTGEEIKIKLGSAIPVDTSISLEIKGKELIDGLPKTVILTDEEIREPVEETLGAILSGIKKILEMTPPELIADIIDNGILLTGRAVLLNGLAERLSREIGVNFYIPDNSPDCVALGAVRSKFY